MRDKHKRGLEAGMETANETHANTGCVRLAGEAAINAYLAVMREPAQDEARVRAVVALDPDGVGYEISGGHADCDQVLRKTAQANLDGEPDASTVQYRWIEANVPAWQPPAEPVVEGECADV